MAEDTNEIETQVPTEDMSSADEPIGRVTDSWLWIRDTKGYGSVTVTFVTIAFAVTTLAYVLSIVEAIGPVTIRPFDVAACSAYFIPVLTLYFGRKFTEAKHPTGEKT